MVAWWARVGKSERGTGGLRKQRTDGWEQIGADLAGADLAGIDSWGAHLAGADLAGADLAGMDSWGAHLAGAGLAGARLAGMDSGGADKAWAGLAETHLAGGFGGSETWTDGHGHPAWTYMGHGHACMDMDKYKPQPGVRRARPRSSKLACGGL